MKLKANILEAIAEEMKRQPIELLPNLRGVVFQLWLTDSGRVRAISTKPETYDEDRLQTNKS